MMSVYKRKYIKRNCYYESFRQPPTRDTPPRDTHEWRGVAANGSEGQTSILHVYVFVFYS